MTLTKNYKHKPSDNPRMIGNVNIYICSEAPGNGKDKAGEMTKSESSISIASGKSKKDNQKIAHAYQGK